MNAVVRSSSPVRHPSNSPNRRTRRHTSPRRRPSHKERSPDHRRTFTRDKSPVRNEKFNNRSRSPKGMRDRSPLKAKESEEFRFGRRKRSRSPVREKLPQRKRSPVHVHSKSPARTDNSRSPSPRTKQLRCLQAERENEKHISGEYTRAGTRERNREHLADQSVSAEGKSTFALNKNDTGSLKSIKHGHSVSPSERSRPRRHSPGSPSRTASRDRARDEVNDRKGAEHPREHGDDSISKMKAAEDALEAKQKQKPSFELSGKLAEETNRVRGVTLLFSEPPDSRKPDVRWRLYVFKSGEVLNEPLYLHRQSSYLFGRERRVADVPTDHPSCSKQHAVIQYRLVETEQPDGLVKKQVRPYLMDLGSTNGTFINDNRIEAQRYYELFEKDTIKFGNSSREYVLLHENSTQ